MGDALRSASTGGVRRAFRTQPEKGRLNEAHAEVIIEEEIVNQELEPLDNQPLAERIAQLAADVKGTHIRALRMRELVQYTDWFVVVSGRSDRQVGAIWEHVTDVLREEDGIRPLSVEGSEQNQWVLVDFGDVVLHVFYEPVRDFYQLEQLWGTAPELDLDIEEDFRGDSYPE